MRMSDYSVGRDVEGGWDAVLYYNGNIYEMNYHVHREFVTFQALTNEIIRLVQPRLERR